MPWFVARSSARRAIGSCTFQISWRPSNPPTVAASRAARWTFTDARSTRRITGGTAKIRAATMAVNRPAENRATAGRR